MKSTYHGQLKGSSNPNGRLSIRIGFLEESKMLLLNRRNSVLGIVDISIGGISETVIDPKVVFVVALKAGANGKFKVLLFSSLKIILGLPVPKEFKF